MTIPRNLSFLAEGASSTGVLQPSYGGTGLTSPGACGVAEIALHYNTLVPDEAENGWDFVDGVASAPVQSEVVVDNTVLNSSSGSVPNVIV